MPSDSAPPPGGPGPGGRKPMRKIAGVPVVYLATGAVVLVGTLVYFWWRKRQAAGSSTDTTGTTGTTGQGTGYDSAELAQLLGDLQSAGSSGGGGTSGGGTSGGGGGYDYGAGYGGTGTGAGTSSGTDTTGAGSSTGTDTGSAGSPSAPAAGGAAAASSGSTSSTPGKSSSPAPAKSPTVTYSSYTVKPGQTLAEIAGQYGISVAQLAHSNVYVPGEASASKVGQTLGTGAGLKTGQVLRVPHYS